MESQLSSSLSRQQHHLHQFQHQHQQGFNPNQYPLQHDISPQQQQQQMQQAMDNQFQDGYLGSNALNRPLPARHSQLPSRQSMSMFSTGSFPLMPSTGTSSGHQTPTQETPNSTQLGSAVPSSANSNASFSNNRFSRTPSPSRSSAHSPPLPVNNSGGSGYSSGRLSPVGLFQSAQPAFGQGQGFPEHTSPMGASSANHHQQQQQQQYPQQQQHQQQQQQHQNPPSKQ
ncbi:hypothetical protein BGZ58_010462 [Dissophora ornata]|nr:hypothetical protein BGZ58_010462 [Dissophora ornata]